MPIRGNMDSKWECFGCGHSNEHSSLKCEKCGALGKELANKQMANHLLGNDKMKSEFEYCCDKCGSESYEVGELRASGGFWVHFSITTNTVFISYHVVAAVTLSFTNEV